MEIGNLGCSFSQTGKFAKKYVFAQGIYLDTENFEVLKLYNCGVIQLQSFGFVVWQLPSNGMEFLQQALQYLG